MPGRDLCVLGVTVSWTLPRGHTLSPPPRHVHPNPAPSHRLHQASRKADVPLFQQLYSLGFSVPALKPTGRYSVKSW